MAVGDIITLEVTDRKGVVHAVVSRAAQDNIMQVLYDADQDIILIFRTFLDINIF